MKSTTTHTPFSISSKLVAGEGLVTDLPTWMEQLCHGDKIRVLGRGMGWVKQHQSKYGYSHAMWGRLLWGRPHFQHLVQVSKVVYIFGGEVGTEWKMKSKCRTQHTQLQKLGRNCPFSPPGYCGTRDICEINTWFNQNSFFTFLHLIRRWHLWHFFFFFFFTFKRPWILSCLTILENGKWKSLLQFK